MKGTVAKKLVFPWNKTHRISEKQWERGGMMERLTKTSDKGGVAFTFDLDITCQPSEAQKILKLAEKLKAYEDAEEQGLILMLPCKVGSTVYVINSRYTKCTREKQEFDEYSCQGCEWLDCDSHKEYYIHTNKSVSLEWIVRYSKEIGKTVFLTKEEAEQVLAEMKGV